MKKFVVPILIALIVLIIACGTGCGGGGGSSTTTGTNGTLNPIRAEAALASDPNHAIDPMNIQAGQSIQFEVVGYDSNRVRHILTSTNWTTTDNGNVSGPLSANGLLTATNSSNGATFTATGHANGTTYSINYQVKPVQATVTGTVLDSNGSPASQVTVIFYNSSGVEVGRAKSQFDGSVTVSVPATATSFNLDPSSLPTQFYYRSFVYHNLRYSPIAAGCNATLPTLTNGTSTSMGAVIIDAASTNGIPNPPPPPPDGCPP